MSLSPSEHFAEYLRREIQASEETAEVVQFGLEVFLSTMFSIAVTLIFAAVGGVIPQAFAAFMGVTSVRVFAGGAHCSTASRCAVVSGLVFAGLGMAAIAAAPYLSFYFNGWLAAILVLGLVATYILAPVDSEAKPIINEAYRQRLHRLSMLAIIVMVALIYTVARLFPDANTIAIAASMGLVWQCFILTDWAHRLFLNIEKGFDLITGKRR